VICRCSPRNMCGKCLPPACAICANDITGDVHREPLGRHDALVSVCASCATEPPIATDGPDRGYEPGDRMPTQLDARRVWAPMGRFK
jgi:hypothetical protein